MNLNTWAARWNISYEAIADLRRELGSINTEPVEAPVGESEAAIQNRIRLEASVKGGRLWRNNVGATYTQDGSFFRYGLVNDSKRMNDQIKSSDLIGIKPVKITESYIGAVLGVFVAREIKPSTWHFTGTSREQAQLRFLELVISMGGDAAFANSEGTL